MPAFYPVFRNEIQKCFEASGTKMFDTKIFSYLPIATGCGLFANKYPTSRVI